MASGNHHRTIKRRERQGDRILRMLAKQALIGERDPHHVITRNQLSAMKLFLDKTHPNLKSIEHKGEVDGKIEVVISVLEE